MAAADQGMAPPPSAPKKKNNNKKKKSANKNKDPSHISTNDNKPKDDDDEEEPVTPITPSHQIAPITEPIANADSNGHVATIVSNGDERRQPGQLEDEDTSSDPETTAKLDAMSKDREALRLEVEQLRKQLENIQTSHVQEVSHMRSELEESNTAKETAEEEYQNLLGRVEKIRESLGERLKRDKAELEETRERIEELETQNQELQNSAKSSGGDIDKLRDDLQDATRELTTLRSRNNLSTQNWQKEKEDLTRTAQRFKEEMEQTTNAMGEWEVIAMEERSMKENFQDRISELEEQVESLREGYEQAAVDRDNQTTLVDNLQNALREIQEARKKELREMVESTEAQLASQKKLAQDADRRAVEAESARQELSQEVERTAPFEKEVKEKNLLIGKLRHEAIVLNDHLRKALRYLKKTQPEDNVDRQVVTNHILHFLTLDRSDAKRFQVLQVMAGYLNWTDEQREQAGLSRPGASSNSLRLPISPFNRTPSSPSLNADLFTDPSTSSREKESLAELWAGFLERSAQEGADGRPRSRQDSGSSAAVEVPGTLGQPDQAR